VNSSASKRNIFSNASSVRFLFVIPLVLAAFTHIWNLIGFPDVFYDEGVYMRRAMHVLEGYGPEQTFYYDHPYFGQIFLGSTLSVMGYASLLHNAEVAAIHATTHSLIRNTASLPSSTIEIERSVEMLYAAPRLIMGILAIADTFLVYKIAGAVYSRKVGLIASIFFAVMPITWFTRRILLDTIQLPFLLLSILFAVYYCRSVANQPKKCIHVLFFKQRAIPPLLLLSLSGIFLGLAIFTKVPAFTIIPLLVLLIYKKNKNNIPIKNRRDIRNRALNSVYRFIYNKNLKVWGVFFIPAILIPLIWPINALSTGQFNYWLLGAFHETQRQTAGKPLSDSINTFFKIDPVLLIIGGSGVIVAALSAKRDFFTLAWVAPYLAFLYFIGYVQYFYFIPLLPAFCIAGSTLVIDIVNKINKSKFLAKKMLLLIVVSSITIFGLLDSFLLITTNVSSQFKAAAYVVKYVGNKDITIISSPVYSWLFIYVYHKAHVLSSFDDARYLPLKTEKVLLIVDQHYKSDMGIIKKLNALYNNTKTIRTFYGGVLGYDRNKYPYTSLKINLEGGKIEIRVN
jgi:hypothetical protein